ncbi:MAG: alpha/beta hydrolase [Anaerolineae bacterium]|nr:alpha/beta hydrolase [Anaerolineae bacterium]
MFGRARTIWQAGKPISAKIWHGQSAHLRCTCARKELGGVAPTYLLVGDMDLFLLEDLAYARKLAEAGVPFDLHVYPGAIHGFDGLVASSGIAQRANQDVVRALRQALQM